MGAIFLGTAAWAGTMMVTYAIGDVHGRFDLLRALVSGLREDADALGCADPFLVGLGDYTDRGPQSRQVMEFISNDVEGFRCVWLKGNHCDMLVRGWHDLPRARSHWLRHGGLETMQSYGWAPGLAADPRLWIPERHVGFLQSLPTFHDDGERLFVHAGIRPGRPLREQTDKDMMWIRDEFLGHNGGFGRTVVHGHTPSEEATVSPFRVGLDTRAYHTGVLSAACFEAGARPRLIRAVGARRFENPTDEIVVLGALSARMDAGVPSLSPSRWP